MLLGYSIQPLQEPKRTSKLQQGSLISRQQGLVTFEGTPKLVMPSSDIER